jgi:hypothetical protein
MVFGFGKKDDSLLGNKGISDSDRDKLLADKKVQEAMKKAGEAGMSDPKVQEAIKNAAKEMFTAENAAKAMDMAKEWANDPEVQAKARHAAGLAMAGMGQAAQQFIGCIEQGPDGLRFLAFVAGVASLVNTVFTIINVGKILGLQFVSYAVALYQAVFAFTTILFEAKPEWIAKVPGLSAYQDMLIRYAKFITMAVGRGAFYIFQGSLWLVLMPSILSLDFLVGCLLIFVGVMHVLMHFGVMPQHVAAKAKEALDKAKGSTGSTAAGP